MRARFLMKTGFIQVLESPGKLMKVLEIYKLYL